PVSATNHPPSARDVGAHRRNLIGILNHSVLRRFQELTDVE
ncbi:14335_t:CDS:1, partial [Acaulospora colombiana]